MQDVTSLYWSVGCKYTRQNGIAGLTNELSNVQEEAQMIPEAEVQVVEKGTGDWPEGVGSAEAPSALSSDLEAPPVEGFQHEAHPVGTPCELRCIVSSVLCPLRCPTF